MATLISAANGGFVSAGTWKVASAVSGAEVDSEASFFAISTPNYDSATFVLAATAVDAIALRVRLVITPTGTMSVILRNSTTSTNVATCVINLSDLRVDATGWHVFSFTPHTPNGTDSYIVRLTRSITDAGNNSIQFHASSGTPLNMNRLIRLVTTGAPATNDKLIIAGEFTGAGASTPYTVTMDAIQGATFVRSAKFASANVEYFNSSNNASMQTGDIDFWVAGWVYLDNLGTAKYIFERTVSGSFEYTWRISTGNIVSFGITNPSQASLGLVTSTFGAFTTSTWYFIIAYHDSVNNLVKISVNGGAFDSTATTGAPTASPGIITFANHGQGGGQSDERLSCMAFGKNPVGGIAALANAIRDSLYNAGARKYYVNLTGTEKTNWGLISFWNLDEVSAGLAAVTRNDSHSTNHLTDINTTPSFDTYAVLSYGPTVSGGPPQGISVNDKSTLTWGTTASTIYYLRWKGVFKVNPGGTVNVGTSGTIIPSTSSATLEMDSVANVDTGFEAAAGSVVNMYGAVKYAKTAITGTSSATPIEITSTAHGLVAGERITIQGVAGGAAQFTLSTQYLSAPSNTTVQTGDIDFWLAGWAYIDILGTTRILLEKGFSPAFEAHIAVDTNNRAYISIFTPAGSNVGSTVATTFGSLTASTWYFIIGYHDSVNNLLGISVNGTAFQTTATTGAPTAGTSAFTLGRPNANTWNGRIDSACFGKNPVGGIAALANAIRDSLYNSGSGKFYSELTGTEKTDWGLISFWDLDEVGCTRYDSHGTNHLGDNGGVSLVQGKRGIYGVNGNWEVIASTGANTFTIGYINGGTGGTVGTSTGTGTYISGGTWARIGYTRMTADAAAAATVIAVYSTAGWVAGDELVIPATTQTRTQCEKMTILTVDSPTQVTLTAGLTFAHSGTAPIQAEISDLTRNIKIRGISNTLQGYVVVRTTSVCVFSNVETLWLGSAVAGRVGFELQTTLGSALVSYCSVHDHTVTSSYGIAITGSTSSNNTVSNCVFYNNNLINFAAAGTTGTWVFSGNLCVLSQGNYCVSLNDIGGTTLDNVAVGGLIGGFNLPENAVLGTFRGNTAHSNTSIGINVGTALMAGGTVANSSLWRNTASGLSINTSGATNVTFDTMSLFGNTTANIVLSAGANLIFKNIVSSGDSTFATASAVLTSSTGIDIADIVFENCTFGVVSGIRTAHTQDFNWFANSYGTITCHNCLFASTTELTGQATMAPGSRLASQKHDQIANSHKTWYRTGTISIDTTLGMSDISPSVRLTPNNFNEKLESSIKVFVASGATSLVITKVRESIAGDGTDYNGARARLICKKNVAAGIPTDVVLATATSASEGAFETISGTTPAITDNAVLTICIDASSTTGWINIDSFTAT